MTMVLQVQVESWPLGPNGLLHDREWALVGDDGRVFSQKTLPQLALVKPSIDLQRGLMQASLHTKLLKDKFCWQVSLPSCPKRALAIKLKSDLVKPSIDMQQGLMQASLHAKLPKENSCYQA